MDETSRLSDEEILSRIFRSGGHLSQVLGDFEERVGQSAMAMQIWQAYQHSHIALIEAGTGIGKSWAYLVPALLWALRRQEKTVISTHTIALQQQLIERDIPFLLKALQIDLKAAFVKGMSNYLCLRKFNEISSDLFLQGEEKQEVDKLALWVDKTEEGSRSELSFSLNLSWDKVAVDLNACEQVKCPHYKK
ncbi:MAG: ATP-dependent DNA helicase, partial [Anaerolineae bacterium]